MCQQRAAKPDKRSRLRLCRQCRLAWLKEDSPPETAEPRVLSRRPSKVEWPLPGYGLPREPAAGSRYWRMRSTEPSRPEPTGRSTAERILTAVKCSRSYRADANVLVERSLYEPRLIEVGYQLQGSAGKEHLLPPGPEPSSLRVSAAQNVKPHQLVLRAVHEIVQAVPNPA